MAIHEYGEEKSTKIIITAFNSGYKLTSYLEALVESEETDIGKVVKEETTKEDLYRMKKGLDKLPADSLVTILEMITS